MPVHHLIFYVLSTIYPLPILISFVSNLFFFSLAPMSLLHRQLLVLLLFYKHIFPFNVFGIFSYHIPQQKLLSSFSTLPLFCQLPPHIHLIQSTSNSKYLESLPVLYLFPFHITNLDIPTLLLIITSDLCAFTFNPPLWRPSCHSNALACTFSWMFLI